MVMECTSSSEHDPGENGAAGPREASLRVGCALLPKKMSRYLTPLMLETAAAKRIELLVIDHTRPLAEQGPFDVILHKIPTTKDWEKSLQDYSNQHPQVQVIDRMERIRTLQNRATMLGPLQGEGIVLQGDGSWTGEPQHCSARIRAPAQVVLSENVSLQEAEQLLEDAGLQPPLIVKPLWTDGREGSHGLAVLHDLNSLAKLLEGSISTDLKPPVVVQQYIEHGGVLYKVYVLGRRTVVSKRPSLGQNYLGQDGRRKGVLQLPRISCKPSENGASPSSQDSDEYAGKPPEWVTHPLANALRKRLNLQLFNFDLICPEEQKSSTECLYYVIDINYFPGVRRIPNFEAVFLDFLRTASTGNCSSQAQSSISGSELDVQESSRDSSS